jgi:hypothetical protein
MSTRGWYEYYVVDRSARTMSKAMQSYCWGDPGPAGAVEDRAMLERVTELLDGRPPLRFVHDLFDENLGEARRTLPLGFELGAYYFLLQRANDDENSLFRPWRILGAPKEEQPDYRLGYLVGRAQGKGGYSIPTWEHAVVDRAHFSIEVGILVHRSPECSSSMTFLRWLQYISQYTKEIHMGLVAGDYSRPSDISYIHRFFIEVATLEEREPRVKAIRLELCDRAERSTWDELERDVAEALEGSRLRIVRPERVNEQLPRATEMRTSLDELRRDYDLISSPMWEGRLKGNGYLGP